MNIVETLNAIRDSEEIREALNEIGEGLETICFIEALTERVAKCMRMENILLIDFLRIADEGEHLRIRIRNVYEDGKKTELNFEEDNHEELRERLKDLKVYVENFFYSHLYQAFIINCISEE